MNPAIICFILLLVAAYFIWQLHEANKLLDELEDEIFSLKKALKHKKWSAVDDPIMKEDLYG